MQCSGATLPLIVFGGAGEDRIIGGDGADIIFGDRGQADFLNEDGAIVTRLGSTPEQFFGSPTQGGYGNKLGAESARVSRSCSVITVCGDGRDTTHGGWCSAPDLPHPVVFSRTRWAR